MLRQGRRDRPGADRRMTASPAWVGGHSPRRRAQRGTGTRTRRAQSPLRRGHAEYAPALRACV